MIVYYKMKKEQENKKIIGFDMDGVILDHTSTKLILAKKFGLNITKKETPSGIIKALMPLPKYRKFQVDLNDNPKFKYLAPPMSGARTVLTSIVKSGLPYFLISRRKKEASAIKILKHHGLWPKYFNKTNAFFVKTPEDKNIKALELGITHYIDDEQKVLNALVSVKNKFLFDPLEAFKNPPKYWRIKSWKEIL